jgi:hypothetical protein
MSSAVQPASLVGGPHVCSVSHVVDKEHSKLFTGSGAL